MLLDAICDGMGALCDAVIHRYRPQAGNLSLEQHCRIVTQGIQFVDRAAQWRARAEEVHVGAMVATGRTRTPLAQAQLIDAWLQNPRQQPWDLEQVVEAQSC